MTSRYLLQYIHQCHVTVRSLSVSLHNQSTTTFYFRNVDRTFAGILKACPCKLECVSVAYIGVYFRILDNDTYDKVVRQRKFRATSRHSFITTVWRYTILYQPRCIREATFVNFNGKCA